MTGVDDPAKVALLAQTTLAVPDWEGVATAARDRFPELLDVLDAAERLLATSGYAVALCPNYGAGTAGTA